MNPPLEFKLRFYAADAKPILGHSRNFLLYNQCDGFHIADALFGLNNEFQFFYFHPRVAPVGDDFFCAWAELPHSSTALYSRFARVKAS